MQKISNVSFALHVIMIMFCVYAHRLLKSSKVRGAASELAIAIQFLDYPLLVLRPENSTNRSDASVVEFKNGKCCVLDADQQEIEYLTSQVNDPACLAGT